MELKSITELRKEIRDNSNYAVTSSLDTVVAELRTKDKYKHLSNEQLAAIAKTVIAKRNSMELNIGLTAANNYTGLPQDTEWNQFSYEELLAMESDGVNIPQEFLDWAHSMQDSDTTNYVMDESELNNSGSLEELDQNTDDPKREMQEKAKTYIKKCQQQEDNIEAAKIDFAPKKDKAEEIQLQSKFTQENGMKKLTDMAKRWNELDEKIQKGESLTDLEKKEYSNLNKQLSGANADLRNKMTETANSLDDLVTSMNEIQETAASDIDLGSETIELANTLAGVQKNYNPKSIKGRMWFMAVGDLANMVYGAKGQSIARDTVDAGIDLQSIATDTQVEMNKNTTLFDFALEYGTSLNEQLEEVEKLLGENPNKDDRTAVTKGENAASENAEDEGSTIVEDAVDKTTEEPETDSNAVKTNATPEAAESEGESATVAPTETTSVSKSAAPVEETKPEDAPEGETEPTSGGNKKEAEKSLDDQGKDAAKDAEKTTPSIEKEGESTMRETEKAQKAQKVAKTNIKNLKAKEKEITKESQKLNEDAKKDNQQIAALNDANTEATEEIEEANSTSGEDTQAVISEKSETINTNQTAIISMGKITQDKGVEFQKKAEQEQKVTKETQKSTENTQKYNSKIEKGISYIDQIAAMGMMKGMSTMGTGAVLFVQGNIMQSVGAGMLSNPFTAAMGMALLTAGQTTSSIGLGTAQVGAILTEASFITLAATKVTKMTIAAVNGDIKGVFKNLGAFATVVASSVASCAATIVVGTVAAGAGPIGMAVASQAAALPFDALAYTANMNLSNKNIKSGKKDNNNEENTQPVEPTTQTTKEEETPKRKTPSNEGPYVISGGKIVNANEVQGKTRNSAVPAAALEYNAALKEEAQTKVEGTGKNNENKPEVVEGETQKSDSKKDKEEVTADSIKTSDGERAAKDNKKEGENVEKEEKKTSKSSKEAKKEGKDLEKTDKALQKEIKATEKELKNIEETIVKLTEDSEAAIAELEAESEAQAQQDNSGIQENSNQDNSQTMMSASAPVQGAGAQQAVQTGIQAAPQTARTLPSAIGSGGSAPRAGAGMSSGGASKADAITMRLSSNVAQINALQSRGTRRTKKIQKNMKTQQKRAVKAQKASEKSQKQNEKLDKALTYVDYAATATKITGKIFMGVGSAQVSAGNALIVTGTPLLSNPFTFAAGSAMVASGTTLDTTGTANIGVGNTLNIIGTYTGMAVKVSKITIAACQGNLMGVLTNAAALGMSCLDGFPTAGDAADAVNQAAAKGAEAALQSGATEMMQNVATNATETLMTDVVAEEFGATLMKEAGKAAFKEGLKTSLLNTDTLMAVGGTMMGAAGSMMSKGQTEEDKRRELHLTDKKRTAKVMQAINRRKVNSSYTGNNHR